MNNQLLATISNPGYGVFTIRIRAYNSTGNVFEDKRIVINKASPPPLQAGWPKIVGTPGYVTSPPTLADLDNDQDMEIIVHTLPCQVYAFDYSGNIMPGWPQASNGDQNCQSTPAVGDVDGDGFAEIFVKSSYSSGGLNTVNGFHHDGTVLAGWPVNAGNIYGYPSESVSLAMLMMIRFWKYSMRPEIACMSKTTT